MQKICKMVLKWVYLNGKGDFDKFLKTNLYLNFELRANTIHDFAKPGPT